MAPVRASSRASCRRVDVGWAVATGRRADCGGRHHRVARRHADVQCVALFCLFISGAAVVGQLLRREVCVRHAADWDMLASVFPAALMFIFAASLASAWSW